MKENAENLKTDQAKQTQDIESRVSKGSTKVCLFPARPDSEMQLAKATAKKLRIPFVDPLRAHIESAATALLDSDIAIRRQALPIRCVDDVLLVAMASPEQPIAIRSLELLTGCKVRPAAAPRSSLCAVLQRVYEQPPRGVAKGDQDSLMATQDKDPDKMETRALTISVISNKGGVGKTHFSINLACALGKTGARVLLIDADLGSADISNKLAIFPKYHLMDFLEKDKQMQDLLVPTDFGFDLIGGTCGEFKLANLYYAQKVKFIKHFKKMSESYDFAVFDLGAGIARTVLDFALGADRTVILTTPQDLISGYACAKASFFRFKEIEQRLEERLPDYRPVFTFSPMLVINQVDNLEQGFKIYNNIDMIADKNINAGECRFRIKPEYLGGIPYDRKSLCTAEEKSCPFLLGFPNIMASKCIEHMSGKFCKPGDSYEPRVKFKNPFKRFVSILTQKI